MESLLELKDSIAALSEQLGAQHKKSLDERRVSDMEAMGKMLDEKNAQLRAQLEEQMRKGAVPGLSADSREAKDFKISNLIRARMTGDYSKCQLEIEMCLAAAQEYGDFMPNVPRRLGGYALDGGGRVIKDLSTISDPGGGFLVPTQVMPNLFIEKLQPTNAIARLGPTVIDNAVGAPVEITGEEDDGDAQWQGESDEVETSDTEYRNIEAYPHLLTTATRLSMRLMRMSVPAAEAQVRRAITRRMGRKEDIAAINGSGASGEPIGILQTPGISTYDMSTRTFALSSAYNDLIGMEHTLIDDDALQGNLKWLLSPDVLRDLKQRVDAGTANDDDQPTERRVLSSAFADRILGYPYVVSTNCPAETMVLGNWDDMYVVRWGTMFLTVDSLTSQRLLKFQLLAAQEMDFQYAHPESFVKAINMGS